MTCGLCGRRFPLKQLSAFIKHKALGTCGRRGDATESDRRRRRRSSSPQQLQADSITAGDSDSKLPAASYKSLRSPSVSASNQMADMEGSASLADSSGTEVEEEEEEEEEEEGGQEGVRRKSASSTSYLLDAATSTSCDTGEQTQICRN